MTAVSAVVERRLLVNWRADPEVVAALLPAPFRPQLVGGNAVVGVCFIRLAALGPRHLPSRLGMRTESAAHRIAVEWECTDGTSTGVYVLRRDTDSRLAALVGGRLFPGVHSMARFVVDESDDAIRVGYTTADGALRAGAQARPADALRSDLFADLEAASRFFRAGSVGWSPRRRSDDVEGVELVTDGWTMTPAALDGAHSTFYEDRSVFPPGSVELDSALLMRDLPAVWRATTYRAVNAA